MDENSLLGIWTGIVHNSNGWDMKITISILQPLEIGAILGIFDIPLMPYSGSLRVIHIRGETVDLRAVKQQGNCEDSESESLELLPDGTLEYISRGKGWERRGILERKD